MRTINVCPGTLAAGWVVFNYLFGNGDAHLKNFSLQATSGGDYVLTPAYDLLHTSIHIDDGDFFDTGSTG